MNVYFRRFILSTLCYIEKDGKYLMLHRTKKKNDINKDKWLGIGGKFEEGESTKSEIEYAKIRGIRTKFSYSKK